MRNKYEKLLEHCDNHNLDVNEVTMPTILEGLKGLIIDNTIFIDKSLSDIEKYVVLSEEIEHFNYNSGDILQQSDLRNRKQESFARGKAFEKVFTFEDMIKAFERRVDSLNELSEMLGLTEEYITDAIEHYARKHGQYTNYKGYYIHFLPTLSVVKIFERSNEDGH